MGIFERFLLFKGILDEFADLTLVNITVNGVNSYLLSIPEYTG